MEYAYTNKLYEPLPFNVAFEGRRMTGCQLLTSEVSANLMPCFLLKLNAGAMQFLKERPNGRCVGRAILIFPEKVRSSKLTWLAGKWTRNEDVFPIKNGDIPLLC